MPDTPASDPAQLTEQAQTEAEEVKADIAETKEAIAEAKAEGDSDRVARLETSLKAQDAKLDKVIEQLAKIADRPFHPAPEPDPAPAAEETPAPETPAAGAKPAKKAGRRASRAFFGSRVDDDD